MGSFSSRIAIAVGLLVTLHPAVAANLIPLEDTTDEERFQITVPVEPGRIAVLSRVTVEGMNYDGSRGYTALLVRDERAPGTGVREEVVTAFVSGQYRLLAFDPQESRLYACELYQHGVAVRIRGIQSFGPNSRDGQDVGRRGSFQYASCNPTSSDCVLVDTAVTVIDLLSGQERTIQVAPPIAADAADPVLTARSGSGGYSLGGEFLTMSWLGADTGELLIRDDDGRVTRRIEVIDEAGG